MMLGTYFNDYCFQCDTYICYFLCMIIKKNKYTCRIKNQALLWTGLLNLISITLFVLCRDYFDIGPIKFSKVTSTHIYKVVKLGKIDKFIVIGVDLKLAIYLGTRILRVL